MQRTKKIYVVQITQKRFFTTQQMFTALVPGKVNENK